MKIMKFSADWCGPCKTYGPIFDKVVAEFDIEVERVNVDKNPDIAGKYRIMGIPATLIIDDNDKEVFRSGSQTEDSLRGLINKYFKQDEDKN